MENWTHVHNIYCVSMNVFVCVYVQSWCCSMQHCERSPWPTWTSRIARRVGTKRQVKQLKDCHEFLELFIGRNEDVLKNVTADFTGPVFR